MYNELKLLCFQVKEEIEQFGEEKSVIIIIDEGSGHYIDHFTQGDYSRRVPKFIQHSPYKFKYHRDKLGNIYKAILDELEKRADY